MSQVQLLPPPRADHGLAPQLLELAESRMVSPARQVGYELRLVGATVLPQQQVIARTEWGTWLLVDHAEDPTAHDGRVPIPAEQYARLAALHDAGVRPDMVWLAHELPATWQEDDPIPQLVPAPRHLREKDEKLNVHLKTATELFLKGSAAVVMAAAAAPLAVAGVAAGAAGGLDPIVLGGVKHPEASVVHWAVLAQWEWE